MVTKRDLEVAIAAYGLGRILPAGSTRAAVRAIIPQVVRGGRVIAPVAARTVGTLAAANPISTGLGLGLGFTQTPAGQELLESAAERGRQDRMALEQYIDDKVTQATTIATSPMIRSAAKSSLKRRASKYNRAVKAGMAAVKASRFNGKKGKITNAKKTFSTVNKVVSAVNKGKKVATKGIRGTIARAARRVFK